VISLYGVHDPEQENLEDHAMIMISALQIVSRSRPVMLNCNVAVLLTIITFQSQNDGVRTFSLMLLFLFPSLCIGVSLHATSLSPSKQFFNGCRLHAA
jgi:hypothetical protein